MPKGLAFGRRTAKDADAYIQTDPLGGGEKGSHGHALYTAPNPPFGATFTLYLRDAVSTRRAERLRRERELRRQDKSVGFPSWDSLRAEEREEAPAVVLEVQTENGEVVRRVEGPTPTACTACPETCGTLPSNRSRRTRTNPGRWSRPGRTPFGC